GICIRVPLGRIKGPDSGMLTFVSPLGGSRGSYSDMCTRVSLLDIQNIQAPNNSDVVCEQSYSSEKQV
ncbi:34995_t:CDS:2, partial [Racocetra persica]